MKKLLVTTILTLASSLSFAHAGKFEAVYTDNTNNLSWSKKLPEKYSNGCVDTNGEYDRSKCTFILDSDGTTQVNVDNSDAAKACRNIGARLPTKSEFESLIRSFDHDGKDSGRGCDPCLTEQGTKDMQTVFKDMDGNIALWSSSISPYDLDHAYVFGSFIGDIGLYIRSYAEYNVRCVLDR